MKKGSILFFEKTFVRPFGGVVRGVEAFNLQLLRDMVQSGWSVCVPADGSWREPFREALEGADCAADAFSAPQVRGDGPPALALLRAAAVAVRESRRRGERFDILFSANDANGVALPLRIALALKAARRLIVFAHKLPYPYFLKLLAPKAHRIVCVSAAVARGFDEAGFGGRTIVQYGVVNAGAWHPAAEEPPADGEEKRNGLRFCVFGSLDSEWKGADTALKAWRLLPEAFRAENELHLVAYSKVPDFSGETGVVAHGWQSGADAPALLRSMDAVLTPSRDPKRLMETFSQAVVQSMLTALPVIHTPIPIFKEKFDDGGGIEASTPQEFAAAMQTLAGDPALRRRLGTEGRRTALQRYIWLFGAFERSVLDPAAAHGAN